jgi:hypothetical protein
MVMPLNSLYFVNILGSASLTTAKVEIRAFFGTLSGEEFCLDADDGMIVKMMLVMADRWFYWKFNA